MKSLIASFIIQTTVMVIPNSGIAGSEKPSFFKNDQFENVQVSNLFDVRQAIKVHLASGISDLPLIPGPSAWEAWAIGTPASGDISLPMAISPSTPATDAGNMVVYCPTLSCVPVTNGGVVHRAARALISSSTTYDAQAEEDALAIHQTIGSGYNVAMQRSAAYSQGQNAYVGNAVYRATTNGTTSASNPPPGTRPVSFPYTYTDGGVTWLWINDFYTAAKVGLYIEGVNNPGGGASWGQATNVHLRSGHKPSDNIAAEFDFFNESGTDCVIGNSCGGVLISMGGTNRSIVGLNINSGSTIGGGSGVAMYGQRINGAVVNDALGIDVSGQRGIGFGTLLSAKYSVGTIDDHAVSPVSYILSGTNSTAGIFFNGSSPVGIDLSSGGYTTPIKGPGGMSIAATGTMVTPSLKLTAQTFSTLPTCNSSNAGVIAYITDASDLIAAWHQKVTAGGGNNKAFIACNGSGWYAFDY